MNKKQIEMIFTDKVTNYLNDGYVFLTRTLNSSYSDCAGSIELYKDNQIVKVGLYTSREHFYDDEILNISTYKMKMENPSVNNKSVWLEDMTLIEQDVYYKIADNYYLTSNEYFETKEVRKAKKTERMKYYSFRRYGSNEWIVMDDRAKKIVLPFVQRQPRCKSKKISDINRVIKNIRPIGHHDMNLEIEYLVEIKGKSSPFVLNQTFTKIH